MVRRWNSAQERGEPIYISENGSGRLPAVIEIALESKKGGCTAGVDGMRYLSAEATKKA